MTECIELEDKTGGGLQYSSGDNEDSAITRRAASDVAVEHSEEQKKQAAPLWKIFRYASVLDVVRIILGSILSLIAGTALPFVYVTLGLVISAFADFIIADTILSSLEALYNTTDIDISLLTNATFNHFCSEELTADSGYTDYLLSDDPSSLLQNNLYTLSYGIVGISVAHLLGVLLSTILWSQTAINQEKRIKSKFIRAILNQDISHYDLRPSTELSVHLIDDIKSIKQGISSACSEIMFQLGSALSSFVLAYYFDWRLSLVATSMIVVLLTLLGVLGTVVGVATVKEQAFLTLASSWGEQVLSSIKTVIAYGGQNSELKRYGDFLRKAHSYSVLKSFSTGILYVFYHTFIHLIFTICLWYGGELFVSCSEINVGEIVSVIFLTTQVCIGIGYLVLPLTRLSESAVAAANIFSVIDREPEIMRRNDANMATLSSFEGSIRLSDVIFSYPSRPDVRVLHGIDLHIKPGQTVALVGPSGCGKSTIMKLIPRIYNTDGGTVLLDECNIRELSVKWLRNQIGIVSQEPVLFNISIAENIGYGKEGATIEEIEAAAKAGNAHDFIMALPCGYNTIVGEGGSQISGGQKQRIAIARALVRDPKILLLDEATSALDTKSEKLVQQALDKAHEGRTTIVIAHRLSTIRTADVIVGIDKGHVVEMGSHSELMEKQGLYYKLVVNQTNEEAEEDDEKKEFTKSFRRSTRFKLRRQSSRLVNRKRLRSRESLFSRQGSSNFFPPVLSRRKSSSIMSDIVLSVSENANEDGNEDIFNEFNQEPTVFQLDDSQQKTSLVDIFKLVKQDWWLLVIGVLACGLVGVAVSSNYILMSRAIEVFTDTDPNELTSRLQVFVLWYAFLAGVGGIVYFIGIFSMGFAADKLSKRIKIESFQKILDHDAAFFDREENSLGDLVLYLVDDPGNINQITGLPLGFLSRVVFAAVASLVVSLNASWAIAFILLPAYPIIIIGFILELYAGKKFSEKASYSDSNRLAVETIENLPTVAALGIDERVARKFEDLLAKPAKYTLIGSTVHAFIYAFSQSSVIFATAGALSVSGHLLDEIVGDTSYSASFSNIILDAFNSIPDFQNARVSASRISDLLSQQSAISVKDNDGLVIESLSADISAKSLSFSYPSRPQVSILNGLDVQVKSGQTLALVGPSGSGKSTIISLLERFYDPTFGDLQLDGKELCGLKLSWLRQQISLVSQEPVLFDMSIADNIRYGANFREVTDEEIQEAAKSANIHDFILTLPEGYNTVVGLKGTQLSGGQKQRVAIARALVRNPKILLLDEATSALDTESERIVQKALDKAREGRTTVIIAHRLSTIQNADCIAVLHKGRVIEHGTHSELMDKKGAYYIMNNNLRI